MARTYRVLKSAGYRIDEIYQYTKDVWGVTQARDYITGLFQAFEDISSENILWRKIPASFGVNGYFTAYEHHYIYWKVLRNGDVGIATILHKRMNLGDRIAEDWKTPTL